MIPVSRPYLPDRARLEKHIDRIYASNCLTNNGALVRELTDRLESYLGVNNLLLVSNGTLALQIAYRTLGLGAEDGTSEAITTPFSFIATSSSLKWQGIQPVFADIDPGTWCLDPGRVEEAISARTRGLVPVHVFGNGCEIEALESIARRHGLKVIYDGAHAFGVNYKGSSILQHGDATTLSFHATKLFHTIEGGAIIFRHRDDLDRARLMINFGLAGSDCTTSIGINCKMNEFQAAMGLSVLDDIDMIFLAREEICEQYRLSLGGALELQKYNIDCTQNSAYFPVLFDSESSLLSAKADLEEKGVFPRRYFYPSLDTLEYLGIREGKGVSGNISTRILCLPVYVGLSSMEVRSICDTIKHSIMKERPVGLVS